MLLQDTGNLELLPERAGRPALEEANVAGQAGALELRASARQNQNVRAVPVSDQAPGYVGRVPADPRSALVDCYGVDCHSHAGSR